MPASTSTAGSFHSQAIGTVFTHAIFFVNEPDVVQMLLKLVQDTSHGNDQKAKM